MSKYKDLCTALEMNGLLFRLYIRAFKSSVVRGELSKGFRVVMKTLKLYEVK